MDVNHYLIPKEILVIIFRSDKSLWYASRQVCNEIRMACLIDIMNNECVRQISLQEIAYMIEKEKNVGVYVKEVNINKGYVFMFDYGWGKNCFEFKIIEKALRMSHNYIECKNVNIFLSLLKKISKRISFCCDVRTMYLIMKKRLRYVCKDYVDVAKTVVYNFFQSTNEYYKNNIGLTYYYVCILGIQNIKHLHTINQHKAYQRRSYSEIEEIILNLRGNIKQ